MVETNFDGTRQFEHCAIEFGTGGLVPVGLKDECRIMECPPGTSGDPKRTGVCRRSEYRKGVVQMETKKADECKQRAHDWFTIPHHHLGNKWRSAKLPEPKGSKRSDAKKKVKGEQCFRPCPAGTVPHSTEDPVTGTVLLGEDQASHCVPVELYMAGTYTDTPAFCASAWIRRLGKTMRENIQEAEAPLNAMSNLPFRRTEAHGDALQVARTDMAKDLARSGVRIVPDGREFALSSSRSCDAQDEVRQKETLEVCRAIRDDPEREGILEEEFGPRTGPTRVNMLKAYCDRLYCGKEDGMCFPDAVKAAKDSPGYDPDLDEDLDVDGDDEDGKGPKLHVYKDTSLYSFGIDKIRSTTLQVSVAAIVLICLAAVVIFVWEYVARFFTGLLRGLGWL